MSQGAGFARSAQRGCGCVFRLIEARMRVGLRPSRARFLGCEPLDHLSVLRNPQRRANFVPARAAKKILRVLPLKA